MTRNMTNTRWNKDLSVCGSKGLLGTPPSSCGGRETTTFCFQQTNVTLLEFQKSDPCLAEADATSELRNRKLLVRAETTETPQKSPCC